MTVPVRKKLIEVALPLAAINEASAKEKSIRHGHPSTLHLWWARRPLAACRAVLFAQFVDDPSSVPEEFPDEAAQEAERQRLFGIIKRLVPWKNSNDEYVLRDARREIARSVARSRGDVSPTDDEIDAYLAVNAPPVVDPFCGGGSIPLEAQRLGLRAHGSDLNPVAVLITKALVEMPPLFAGEPPVNPDSLESLAGGTWSGRGATGLVEDLRYYSQRIRAQAEKRIGQLFPKVEVTQEMTLGRPDLKPYAGRELKVIAWLWARTVASPNPAVRGSQVPLVRSFVLRARRGRRVWVDPVIGDSENGYRFVVRTGPGSPPNGTVNRRGGRCVLTDTPISFAYIRGEGKAGRMGTRLMAIVAEGNGERVYLPPVQGDEAGLEIDQPPGPRGSISHWPGRTNVVEYGMTEFADLFTDRQLVALATFADLVGEARNTIRQRCVAARGPRHDDDVPLADDGRGAQAYADAVSVYLGLAVSKLADLCNSLCRWEPNAQCPRQLFGRQAIPMVWDFAEGNPLGDRSGSWHVVIDGIVRAFKNAVEIVEPTWSGRVLQADAASHGLAQNRVVSTDPPYYDNISYADLSDFFYVWLRRSLRPVFRDFFRTIGTPKSVELIASPYRQGGKDAANRFFLGGMGRALSRIGSQAHVDFPVTIYYAFKQSETTHDGATTSTGWETFLDATVQSGFAVTATWPLRTENSSRLLGMGKNVLASSIVLACRPREVDAPSASNREFLAALRRELPRAIRRLQMENIAPVDLAQAAIGPGMAVFSRYAEVLEADGQPMRTHRALVEINRILDETLSEAEGDVDADTRFCVAWFEQFGMAERPYGEAEVLFTAKATSFEGVERAGVLVGGAGKVRLKQRDELEEDWDPEADDRVADWECVQHLVRAMTAESGGGVAEAARLAIAMGTTRAERSRRLAYRLHAVSERKGWSAEALAYNVLATSWPQIQAALAELRQGEQTQLPV